MKIRTDFVTNSSSSSFTVSFIVKTDTKKIKFTANGQSGDEPDYGKVFVRVSPKELATSRSIESLIKRLKEGVILEPSYLDAEYLGFEDNWDCPDIRFFDSNDELTSKFLEMEVINEENNEEDEDEEWYEYGSAESEELIEGQKFIKKLSKIEDIKKIEEITMIADFSGSCSGAKEIVTYNCKTGEQNQSFEKFREYVIDEEGGCPGGFEFEGEGIKDRHLEG